MKKLNMKSAVLGFVIGTISVSTVFAAEGIKSATLSNAKVTLDGSAIPLSSSLVNITKGNETDGRLYMPVRELLEYLDYSVDWDGKTNTVKLNSGNNPSSPDSSSDSYLNEGSIAAKGNISGQSFTAQKNDTVTISLSEDLNGTGLENYKFKIKVVITGEDKQKHVAVLNNNEREKTIKITRSGNHTVTIYNLNNQIVNYKFSLDIVK